MGVFFIIIIFSLADRQTAHYYRVICGFGVSLYISSASEDSCSFIPMRYPRISIRRCVGRSGISFWSVFGRGPTTGASAGNRRNRLCKRTRAYHFILSHPESTYGFNVSEFWRRAAVVGGGIKRWRVEGGQVHKGPTRPSSSRK